MTQLNSFSIQIEKLEKDITYLDEKLFRVENNANIRLKVLLDSRKKQEEEIELLKFTIMKLQESLDKLFDYTKKLDGYLRGKEVYK